MEVLEIQQNAQIIEGININVLKSFKTLQQKNNIIYTSAVDNHLMTLNASSMVIYKNPEINFEGTFKLTRSKLIPVKSHLHSINDIKLEKYNKEESFDKNIIKLQQYAYDNNIRINFADVARTIGKLVVEYPKYTLYTSSFDKTVLFEFKKSDKSTTYFISKLI